MKENQIIQEIDKLGLSEKLILVEDIWDSIALNNTELPMPEWQKVELEKRYSAYKSGKLELYDWKEVHSELRKEIEFIGEQCILKNIYNLPLFYKKKMMDDGQPSVKN